MTQGPDPTAANPDTGFGYASFLLGVGSGSVTTYAAPAIQKLFAGWYLQDTWRVTPKLTLSLGLRYDFQTAPTERFNRLSWFNFSGQNPIGQAAGVNAPGYLVYTTPGQRGVYNTPYNIIMWLRASHSLTS
ncbi:MAG: hypothetical protein WAM39_14535 [Bryobacteraceae bacterium]